VQSPFDIFAGPIPINQCLEGKSMAKMPHAAFSPECRGQENAA